MGKCLKINFCIFGNKLCIYPLKEFSEYTSPGGEGVEMDGKELGEVILFFCKRVTRLTLLMTVQTQFISPIFRVINVVRIKTNFQQKINA